MALRFTVYTLLLRDHLFLKHIQNRVEFAGCTLDVRSRRLKLVSGVKAAETSLRISIGH